MASKTPILDGPDDFQLYYHTNEEVMFGEMLKIVQFF